MSFAYGLFEGKGTVGSAKFQPVAVTFSGPEDNDKVLRPSDACPRYEKDIEDGGVLQQYHDFRTGSEIKKVTEKLEERLNVSGKLELQAEELFKLCVPYLVELTGSRMPCQTQVRVGLRSCLQCLLCTSFSDTK